MSKSVQVSLLVLLAAVACQRTDPCSPAAASGDARLIAKVCGQQFDQTANTAAGLAALRARVGLGELGPALELGKRLEGTAAEPDAATVLATFYETRREAEGLPFMARATERLRSRGLHRAAAEVSRAQGRLAWALSRYREAVQAFERSMACAREAKDPTLEMKARRGIFTMLYELGDVRAAGRVHQEAVQAATTVDEPTRARITFDKGLLAEASGQLTLARASFEAVLRSPAVAPRSKEAWMANMNRLALALRLNDLKTAEHAQAQVNDIFANSEVHREVSSRIARTLYAAELSRRRGQPQAGLEVLTRIAGEKKMSPQWAWKVALERGKCLRALGRVQDAEVSFEQSAAIVEKLRGDQFDELRPWVLEQRRAPFVELFEGSVEAGRLDRALAVFERTQGQTFLEAFATHASLDKAAETVARVEWLRGVYPALSVSPVLRSPVPVERLRVELSDVDAVAFLETDERLYVVSWQAARPRILTASLSFQQIKSLVADLVSNRFDGKAAEALGEALFPEGSLPAPGGRLYVIPSPALAQVPFAALRRRGRFLVQDHVLSEIPSLSALVVLRQSQPSFSGAPVVLANASADLPEAENEARWVASRLPGKVRLSVGADASSSALRSASGARVLHLALHSGIGPAGPWLGLSDRKTAAPDLLEWRVAANTVVLASCASAATPSPGLWGSLVSSFLAAGSPSVVGSLWSTEDQVNRRFVQRFYESGGARDPAAAVARVQRDWLAAGHPVSEWAAFAAFGQADASRRRSSVRDARAATRSQGLSQGLLATPRNKRGDER